MVLKWVIEHWILPSLQYPYGTWGYWYRRYVAFRCYDFESFRGYLKNMQALTKRHREIVTQDEADFQHDMKWIWFLKSLVLNGRKSDSRTPQGRCQKWESHIKSLPSWNSVKRCTMKSKDSGEAILAAGSGSATRKQGRCTRATWMNWEGCGHTIMMLSS